MLIDPNENGYECSDIPTHPDYTPEMSTCPITKNQMFSGEWIIVVLGNNDDDDSFAYQRNINITAGPQQTVTATPTATFNLTITPTSYAVNTSTVVTTSTANATTTVVVPAATHYSTTTPSPVVETDTYTITRTKMHWTKTRVFLEETVTPTCYHPERQNHADPWCSRWPKNLSLIHI